MFGVRVHMNVATLHEFCVRTFPPTPPTPPTPSRISENFSVVQRASLCLYLFASAVPRFASS